MVYSLKWKLRVVYRQLSIGRLRTYSKRWALSGLSGSVKVALQIEIHFLNLFSLLTFFLLKGRWTWILRLGKKFFVKLLTFFLIKWYIYIFFFKYIGKLISVPGCLAWAFFVDTNELSWQMLLDTTALLGREI